MAIRKSLKKVRGMAAKPVATEGAMGAALNKMRSNAPKPDPNSAASKAAKAQFQAGQARAKRTSQLKQIDALIKAAEQRRGRR